MANMLRLRFTFAELCVGLGLWLLLFPWPLQLGQAQTMSTDLSSLLFCAVIAVAIVKQPRLRANVLVTAVVLMFVVWLAWIGVSWLAHPYGKGPAQLAWHTFKNGLNLLPFPIIGCLLGAASPRLQRFFLYGVVALVTLAAAIGIVQTASGGALLSGILTNQRFLGLLTPLPPNLYETFIQNLEQARATGGDAYFVGSIFRAHGPFLHPNPYTAMVTAGAGFTLGAALTSSEPRPKRRLQIAFAIQLIGLGASLGLTGLAALAAVMVYAFVIRSKSFVNLVLRPWIVVLLGAALLGVVLWALVDFQAVQNAVPPQLAQRLVRLVQPQRSAGFNGRFALWGQIVERVAEQPLFGADRPVTARDAGWFDSDTGIGAHNSYLATALYSGLPGMLLLIALLFVFLRASWVVYSRSPDELRRQLAFACHLLFVALAIMGLAVDWISDTGIAGLFFLCGGVCTALAARVQRRARQAAPVVPQIGDSRAHRA